jgi:hypothetical protein
MVLAISTFAYAENFFYTVTPADLADGPTFLNGQGGVPFGYDPDKPPPIGVFEPGPAGFGNSSFWSNLDTFDRRYTALRMSPKDIFDLTDVTIGDLSYISYWTKNLDLNKWDWQIKIYTEGDATHWYGYRFEFIRPTNIDITNWYQSSTNSLAVNKITSKWTGDILVTGSNDEFSELVSIYGTEKILFIDIIAGNASSATFVNSLLDGVEIGLQNGDVATMDLEFFKNLGDCISTSISEECSGLKGKDRAYCNHDVKDLCREEFGK